MLTARSQLAIGIWLAALTAIVAVSVALGAGWSTTSMLIVMSAAPMGIALLLGFGGGRSMTTHDLLYALDASVSSVAALSGEAASASQEKARVANKAAFKP